MHEMSLTASLLSIIQDEMRKHQAKRLLLVRVRHGVLANVVPEAMSMAFEVQTSGTELEGARLELVEEPLRLACGACGLEFSPESRPSARFSPCPACGEELGHIVLAGKEPHLARIDGV